MNMEFTKKTKITEEDEEINVLHMLNEYADSNPDFNSNFIDSCDQMFEKSGYLSGNQINKLIGIYEKIKSS